ncbi:MAG: CDP-glucose 4,6-dehydratase [Thermoplasmatales archaeon]|nr:CDP-glucose 4,6-dehydratase [Thermoplasmatales archaeon]
MKDKFFKDKKVMITGHTGFIGSWLTKWLLMKEADIKGYSLDPPTEPNMYNSIDLSKNIKDIRKDIRDVNSLRDTISEFQPELVFHLAAQPIVLESYDSPVETFDTNVMGTVDLLDNLRRINSVKVIIVMTSDKVYRNNEWVYPYREIDPLGGKDPYSASKSCQDIVVNSFRESYFNEMGVSVSSIRAGNIIGGGDWGKYRIVPDIVRGLTSNKIVKIRNPDAIRPWQYVLEPLSGMLMLARKMWNDVKYSREWNFGPNNQRAITVKELADKFIENWDTGSYSITKSNDKKESNYLELDISRAKNELNWFPRYGFEESVEKTVEWYREYYRDRSSINKITENQIMTYFEG